MKNLEVLLLALPAVVMFGFTIYVKHIHDGKPKEQAITLSWTYGILAAGFFVLIYLIKFVSEHPTA